MDLVILGEGYQAAESEKFKKDLAYFTNLLFSVEPYKSRKKMFNITGIFSPSEQSGTDQPRELSYKNTRITEVPLMLSTWIAIASTRTTRASAMQPGRCPTMPS